MHATVKGMILPDFQTAHAATMLTTSFQLQHAAAFAALLLLVLLVASAQQMHRWQMHSCA